MKYAVFCDLDGTLLFDEEISYEDLEAIINFKKRGNKFFINSGRPLRGVVDLMRKYRDLIDGYILMNGSLILDANLKTIYKKPIDISDVSFLIETLKNYSITVETLDKGYIYPRIDYEPWYKDYFILETDCSKLPINDVYQICIFLEKSKISYSDLKESLSGHNVSVFGNVEFVDLVNSTCDKGIAMEQIIDIESFTIVGIGDSENDIPMLNKSELAYCVGNRLSKFSYENAKSVADILRGLI